MKQDTTHVGLDAHKDSISVATLPPGKAGVVEWQVAHEAAAVRKMTALGILAELHDFRRF